MIYANAPLSSESAARVGSAALAMALLFAAPIGQAEQEAKQVRIMAVGDIMLDAVARPVMEEFGYNYPFILTKPLFDTAGLVFGNLEGPLTDRGTPQQDKTFVFRSPAEPVAKALRGAGFTVVSLANNHTMDYGPAGLEQTLEVLDRHDIAHAGAGLNSAQARAPAIIQVGDQRVVVLAYSLTYPENFWASWREPGTAFGHEVHVREDVENARKLGDIVLVSFHWGRESQTTLRDYQIQLGHAAIDAGAAAVIGHHPHILQSVEQYKGGVILYSLGNFAFGSRSRKSVVSAIAELEFDAGTLRRVRMLPLNVDNLEVQYQPRPLSGGQGDAVIAHIIELSKARQTTLTQVGDAAVLEFIQQ
jgi:poly-gamma-glutamate capsule biosynthesis protein CapA/YwtB (metallophosphatase superfamily)